MKRGSTLHLYAALVALLTAAFAPAAMAQDEKPFAEARYILQISDMDPDKQTLVLNVASNIIKNYGQDRADVEIVAFGPGLRLLFEGNSNSGRIDSLAESGVRFFACQNTIANMTNTLGEPIKLNPHHRTGTGAIVRIKELVDQGYILVKP